MIDKARLIKKAHSYDISIEHCVDVLAQYAQILVEYNEKVNLTAITAPQGIEDKHFIDSLLFAAQPQIKGRIVDVGTGAGFPGLVAKIYNPALDVTLMEPTGKRVDFLNFVCAELLIKAEIVKERAEEAARKKYREAFDIATARAVAPLNILSEYCLPLVKEGGLFIALKGEALVEINDAKGAIQKLGGKFGTEKTFVLPDTSHRCLVFINKISQTPPVYPRNGGKIAKSPLM